MLLTRISRVDKAGAPNLDLQHPEQAIPLSVEAPTNSLPQASTPLRAGLPLKIQRKNSEDGRSRPAGAAAVEHCSTAKPKPSPVIEKKASIGFGPRRERAGQRLTAAVTTIKTAEGDVKLLGLLTVGVLIIRARDFDAWYRSERAKGKWPSQRSKLKIGGGRPTKQVERLRKAVIKLVHDGKWSGKASIAKLNRLLIDSGGFEVPSPDTLARLVERLHAETGEAEFFRAKRTRRK